LTVVANADMIINSTVK